ncbi:FMN-binding protein [Streptosporangiaceae bacterium NEAU-GS5]|nr:FMN-binding protein [Streptosporangiaceae bacterium NEAU-GS5]
MVRAFVAVVATVFGLVLLLSFKPHEMAVAVAPPAAVRSSPQAQRSERPVTPSTSAATTVAGDTADTRWGPVQVKITVSDGKITDVRVPISPDGNRRDIEIARQALPILVQETLDAQSAHIDAVSGATYTSEGYVTSLQSAIDKAGL